MTITPNIDTKALRELRDDACNLNGRSLMEVLHAQQKYERAIINAAPALLDLADRAQEQAKEIERLNAGWQECLDALAIARNTLAAGADERDALRSTVQQKTEQRDALKAERRTFPLQPDRKAKPGPVNIPWSVAEKAYGVYALRFGKDQTLERLAERAGFSWSEMDMFLPDWREECSEIDALRAKLSASEREVERLRSDAEKGDYIPTSMYLQRCEELRTAQREAESVSHWIRLNDMATAKLSASEREAERLRAALTPSGETKAAYSHEFAIRQTWQDENGADCASTTYVPWTTIKDIMAAISKRAALRGEEAPRE